MIFYCYFYCCYCCTYASFSSLFIKKDFLKFHKIYRKTPMLESLFQYNRREKLCLSCGCILWNIFFLKAQFQVNWKWKSFKNDEKCFLFQLISSFILKIFKFLSWLFGHVQKQFDQKNKVNFKIYDVTTWEINNYNTRIAHYRKK